MLIILFGEAGVGKSHLGTIFAKQNGFMFWDADDLLPTEMKETIQKGNLFTQSMRDQFVDQMIQGISKRLASTNNLIVAQALYKEKNRNQLLSAFPKAKLVWIKAEELTLKQRLQFRPNGICPSYASQIKSLFEKPLKPDAIISNDDHEQVALKQLSQYLFYSTTPQPSI